ncbi:type II toxin-antitoxin system VapC family toxin [Sphingomonas bacterium]|uniref:type II toxin-antitoxin system VapC family toxin n=1 Tax=Sphingomonas bacterium TaxID=1895847 RepID=UPI001575B896|nr:type II toxin-antitoxin system VapC family toxin [Sphingomonas bacterium]
MAYPDTSLLIAALTIEPATDRAQRWLGDRSGGALRISGWTIVEFSSGLAVKFRHGTLPETDRRRAIASLNLLVSRGVLHVETITTADYTRATAFIDDHRTTLRAGDALHLAVAYRTGEMVWTLDHGMIDAAEAIGITCRSLPD